MSEEIKVVISIKGERGFIGVQAPDCDPILASWSGDLATALARIPGLVEEAQQQWDANPRYPQSPVPPPSETQPSQPRQSQSRQVTREPKPQMDLF